MQCDRSRLEPPDREMGPLRCRCRRCRFVSSHCNKVLVLRSQSLHDVTIAIESSCVSMRVRSVKQGCSSNAWPPHALCMCPPSTSRPISCSSLMPAGPWQPAPCQCPPSPPATGCSAQAINSCVHARAATQASCQPTPLPHRLFPLAGHGRTCTACFSCSSMHSSSRPAPLEHAASSSACRRDSSWQLRQQDAAAGRQDEILAGPLVPSHSCLEAESVLHLFNVVPP